VAVTSGRTNTKRRTQAERSASTREKIIQAAIDCIVEEGVQNTTASQIAKRSGVTWGATAHQFGDKDSVFMAVVEHNLDLMSKRMLDSLSLKKHSPRERVELLIDQSWEHCNIPSSLAYTQLVLLSRNNPDSKIKDRQAQLTAEQSKMIWDHFFGDLDIDPQALETARNLVYATLLGMSIQGMVGKRKPQFRRELAALKKFVLATLKLDS
jgi:AcrR family transcriptional regulator